MQAPTTTETRIDLSQMRQALGKPRAQLKGRQVMPEARAEVQSLIGLAPAEGHRRDLLIEHLHVLNDHFRGLFERHLVALAAEMRLSVVEVFEVAEVFDAAERCAGILPALTSSYHNSWCSLAQVSST